MNAVTDQRDAIEPPPGSAASGAGTTRVRTLLICDLADSTELVERLGDAAAAELFRRHDRQARDLLQRFRGREIDKTDGFLALFERPVEALGFALHYQHTLRALGDEVHQTLRARVGIHVGEVVLWENTRAEIEAGAKPVEVEGLAKPVAARLMALALPGQVLLSGIAFTLAQRAEKELETRAPLRWLTHGRYHFKGVPAPMLVHEVGEAGFAPLHAPPSGAKAQREVPLWRRPGVLALEAIALLAAIAVPLALSLRAKPAIAFGERDWIVMAELNNLTGQTLLDDSLDTAFRVSLEQSRYVNVLSDLKLRDALARMQKPADTAIDRTVASEIALREGARAVILPTVAEIGGRVRVSAEVIDPHTQTTVYAESADGIGAASALGSIDQVTQTLRGKLGEALSSIERDSAPLPQVTSGSIEALRAYALGQQAYQESRLDEARALYGQALALDADFALARTGLARVEYRRGEFVLAADQVQRALAARTRLTARDALYVDAWAAYFGSPEAALEKWKLLTTLYPDHLDGVYNLALFQAFLAYRFEACLALVPRLDVAQYAWRADAVYLAGSCELGLDRTRAALASFERAQSFVTHGSATAHAAAHAARRDFERALARLTPPAGDPIRSPEAATLAAVIAADRGDLAAARAQLAVAIAAGSAVPNVVETWRVQDLLLASGDGLSADEERALRDALAAQAGALVRERVEERRPASLALLALALVAARDGNAADAQQALAALEAAPALVGYPLHLALRDAVRAEVRLAQGEAGEALEQLGPLPAEPVLLQQWVSRARALAADGRHADAARQWEALMGRRGRAYAELHARSLLVPLNVVDTQLAALGAAEAWQAAGDTAAMQRSLAAFARAWPEADWPESVRRRVARLRG